MDKLQKKLSVKQQKFCHEFIVTGNSTAAAISAGYSKATARQIASENLTKPYIQQYIKHVTKKLESQLIADAKEILKFYTSIMRNKEVEFRERIKAADSLAKAKGMFVTKVDMKADMETDIKVKKLEDYFKW